MKIVSFTEEELIDILKDIGTAKAYVEFNPRLTEAQKGVLLGQLSAAMKKLDK